MKKKPHSLFIIFPLLFLGIFYFYPLISIFFTSFQIDSNGLALNSIKKLFTDKYWIEVLWFTTWQAALSTLLTMLVALPGAWIFARFNFKGKALIQTLTTIPFVLPTVVTAAAFKSLLGTGGLANQLLMAMFDLDKPPICIDHTVWFFLLAHVFFNYTVVLRIVGGFWSNLSNDIGDAARMLGATPRRVFFKVTLPLIMPSILAAAMLIFVFCFTSFGVVLILGGAGLATLEVEIYRQAVDLFNLPMAATLSMFQLTFTFIMMWFYTRLEKQRAVAFIPNATGSKRNARTFKEHSFIRATLFSMFILLGTPILSLVFSSFSTEKGFGFFYYLSLFKTQTNSILFVPPATAIINSFIYAFAATIIAIFIGLFCALFLASSKSKLSELFDPLFMLPLSTSAVTLGFGFIIALDHPPLDLRTSVILPAIAHSLVGFPFVIRCLLPALRSIPSSLKDAAAILGASPFLIWRKITWPLIRVPILIGAIFAFAISMGEFGATTFVARPNTPTMPIAIFRYLNQPGSLNYGRAMAMSTFLMLSTSIGFILIEKFRIKDKKEK